MSDATSLQEKEDADVLFNLVKDLQFLKYEHSIEQIEPSGFSFAVDTEYPEVRDFSEFGMNIIKDFLHIGMISRDSKAYPSNQNQILMLVWPQFVSPTAYGDNKMYLPGLEKIKILIFQVPESVYLEYSKEMISLNDIIAATAILTRMEHWKLLERMVISSFYNLIFDKPTTGSHGDINIWQNYSKDKLDKGWQQLLFICCGPQGLAYLVKKMLKRNWACIVREATSKDATSNDGYNLFCTGDTVWLLVVWAKFPVCQDVLLKFLEEVNSVKPPIKSVEIIEKVKISFHRYVTSSKRHRCTICPYETDFTTNFQLHLRTHTGERPFVCKLCKQGFQSKVHLNEHTIRSHTGIYPYQCKYCAKPYMTPSHVKVHVSVHEKKGDVDFRCHKCSHIFKDETMLKDHMPSHANDPVFECTVCHKKLDSEPALLTHSRIHDKEKSFECDICGKGFPRKQSLTRHYHTHSESRKTFPCQFCEKVLVTAESRRNHVASKHEEQLKV